MNVRPQDYHEWPREAQDRWYNEHAPIGATRTARKMEIEWFEAAATAAEVEKADPLIDGLLDAGAMSVLYGIRTAARHLSRSTRAFT
jgi:hypothetical protein